MSDQELGSPAFLADPYPFYARWREESPVWWSDRLGGAVVVRYDDVRRVMSEPGTFGQSPIYDGAFVDAFDGPTLPALDPPEHTLLRKTVAGHFRMRIVEAMHAFTPSGPAPPPHKWGGQGLPMNVEEFSALPARPLRRHLPINGEDRASTQRN